MHMYRAFIPHQSPMPGADQNACILPMSTIYGVLVPRITTTEIITMETIGSTQHTTSLSSARPSRCLSSWPAHPSFLILHLVFLSVSFFFFQIPSGYTHPSSSSSFFMSRLCLSSFLCISLTLSTPRMWPLKWYKAFGETFAASFGPRNPHIAFQMGHLQSHSVICETC
ncbi:hypothetical protein V8C34DRAFT_170676 [Trichoderma compactum]